MDPRRNPNINFKIQIQPQTKRIVPLLFLLPAHTLTESAHIRFTENGKVDTWEVTRSVWEFEGVAGEGVSDEGRVDAFSF